MFGVPIDAVAAERARLLAELAAALDQAERLLIVLPLVNSGRDIAGEVHLRIQAAKLEIESLRRSRSIVARGEADPERIKSSPWTPETFAR